MTEAARVAIVGAGIAGLSCARFLADAGLSVRLFEKARAPGGRLSTRRETGWQCDHGAQYFTVRDDDFRVEVARWGRSGVVSRWSPRLAVAHDGRLVDSTEAGVRYVGTPRMSAISRFLARDLDIRTTTGIAEIAVRSGRWCLVAHDGATPGEGFDALALAVPAPQASALLPRQAQWLRGLADSVTMRPCWALMLGFDAPLELPFDAAIIDHEPLRWIARDRCKPGRVGRETWLLHATPAWSAAHIESEPYDIASVMVAAFSDLGAPPPATWHAHRWRYADAADPPERGCAWAADLRLGMCGDWLNGNRVEGAWLSGRALARRICHSLGVT